MNRAGAAATLVACGFTWLSSSPAWAGRFGHRAPAARQSGAALEVSNGLDRRQKQLDAQLTTDEVLSVRMLFDQSLRLQQDPTYPALMQRLAAMDKAWAAKLGDRAIKVVGDDQRVTSVSPDAASLAHEVAFGCPGDRLAEYDAWFAKVDRLLKDAPQALRYLGPESDTLTQVLDCIATQQKSAAAAEDTYVPPKEPQAKETTCAVDETVFEQEKTASGWTEWYVPDFEMRKYEQPKPVPCASFPKKGTGDRRLAATLTRLISGKTQVMNVGQVATMNVHADRDKDYTPMVTVHRVGVQAFGRYAISKPCEGKASACESSGSTAATVANQVSFWLMRADKRRQEGRADLCRKLIAQASDALASFQRVHTDETSSGEWNKSATYLLRDGRVLTDDAIVAELNKADATVQDHKLGYCDHR